MDHNDINAKERTSSSGCSSPVESMCYNPSLPMRPLEKESMLSVFFGNTKNSDYMPVRSHPDDEEIMNPNTTDSERDPVTPLLASRRKRRARKYLICGSIWGLTILALIVCVDLALEISRNLWGIDDDPDKIFGNWGQPGTGTEGLAWYPTDFLRDVRPIPCHSHNDYWRKVPLFSALHAGCIGVEADVWLFDDGPNLYVGHDTAALQSNRTFESLYINPIVELLKKNNPETEFYNDTRRGIFDVDPEQTLILLVDVKTDGAKTWPHVLEQLEPLRSRGWLTYVQDGVVHKGQVIVVGTGNTPFDLVIQNSTYRDAFFDAPLDKMWEDPSSNSTSTEVMTYNSTNSYYASVSFGTSVGSVPLWSGLTPNQLRIIRGQLNGAHRRGLKARYWDLPEWPIGLRNQIWHDLVREGVDILNVDDLRSASRKPWRWENHE